ncbi:Uncharacterised protein [Mycobacteroides abscessus subsp. abscessus]|nr:Uncharacterised protein [Mycobacteroides abscessus subsp. abscessus]
MYLPYRTKNGSLRWNRSRSCAMTSGVKGRSPANARMGSPGSAYTRL